MAVNNLFDSENVESKLSPNLSHSQVTAYPRDTIHAAFDV